MMETKSVTVIRDGCGNEIVNIHRRFDGYPSGHGLELADILDNMLIVDGMTGKEPEKFANGMGCLAAQVVKLLKNKRGNIYLYPPGITVLDAGYVYTVTGKVGGYPNIKCQYGDDVLFNGSPDDFKVWASSDELFN